MRNFLLSIMFLVAVQVAGAQNNPILKKSENPDTFLYAADPAAEVYNGKVYVYCSHDQPNARNYSLMKDYIVLESSDLKTWINHGVTVDPTEFSWVNNMMNAPDGAYKDGWYYLYYPGNITHVGVVKSRTPVGPWQEAAPGPITAIFDPTVFIDDDGQAYIFGNDHKIKLYGNTISYIYGAKLKKNMIELDGEWQRLSAETVNEAVHIFKREGKYYFTARIGKTTGYFMSDCPLPTKDKGYAKFMGNITPSQSDAPAHNSVIEFQGEWYLFYQRGDVNEGSRFKRSACFDKMYFNPDGSIKPVVYTLGEQN